MFQLVTEGLIDKLEIHRKSGDSLHVRDDSGRNLLHQAAANGHRNTFKYLTEQGLDPHVVNKTGTTVLHDACAAGQYEMVKFLCGIYPQMKHKRNMHGETALHSACTSKGTIEIFQFLLDQGLDIRSANSGGTSLLHTACTNRKHDLARYIVKTIYMELQDKITIKKVTPLHHIAASGNVEVFKLLVQKGFDVHSMTNTGINVLHVACTYSKYDMAKYLVSTYPELKDIINNAGSTALHCSAQGGNVEITKLLVEQGFDVYSLNNRGSNALHIACFTGKYDMVKYLVSTYPELKDIIDMSGKTALQCSAQGGNVEIFKLLVEQGFDVYSLNNNGSSALHIACLTGKYDMVKYLVSTYPELKDVIDKGGRTALHCSAKGGNVEIFKLLVEQGFDVYSLNNNGSSALHLACLTGKYDMVKYLTSTYPELKDIIDMSGWTALQYSAHGGNVEITKLLVEQGFDVYSLNNRGSNALHIACSNGKYDMAMYLVSTYPELKDVIDMGGWTALHRSAQGGNVEISKLLISRGLDIYDRTLDGEDVLHISCRFDQSDLIKYLVAHHPEMDKSLANASRPDRDTTSTEQITPTISIATNIPSASTHHQARGENTSKSELLGNKQRTSRTENTIEDQHLYKQRLQLGGINIESCTSGVYSFIDDETFTELSFPGFAESLKDNEDLTRDPEWPLDIAFLSPSLLRNHIMTKGNASKQTVALLQWICSRFEATATDSNPIDRVWCGYSQANTTEPVLVAIGDGNPSLAQEKFETFDVVYRKNDIVSEEAKYITRLEMEKGLIFAEEEKNKLHDSLIKHSKILRNKHTNLEIVSASKIKSRNYGQSNQSTEEITCIVLYVHVKGIIPFDEEPFPEELDGFPVDVREGLYLPYANPCDYHQKLMMGCQIQSVYDKCGTLGGFVHLPNGNVGCLTCWHVFLSDQSKTDQAQGLFNGDVFQPDTTNASNKIGKVIKHAHFPGSDNVIGMDAALIEVLDPRRLPKDGAFPDATNPLTGFSSQKPMVFTSGKVVRSFNEIPMSCNVVKYGMKTGHTVGMLRLSGTSVEKTKYTAQTSSGTYELHQQLEVFQPEGVQFSHFGDSGALVFLVTDSGQKTPEITALGILVGGTTHNTTIVTPIWAILERFGLAMQMLPFQDLDVSNMETDAGANFDGSVNKSFRLGVLEGDMSIVKSELTDVKSDVVTLKQDVGTMKTNIGTIDQNVKTLGSQMGVVNAQLCHISSVLQQMEQFSSQPNQGTSADSDKQPSRKRKRLS